MKLSLTASALVLSLFAAACGVAETTSDSSAQALDASIVKVVPTAAGDVLANVDGLSLYTFDRDVTTESTCYNACATKWPALLAGDYDTVVAPFGITTRTDGTKQVTKNGHPLYRFAGDAVQGDIKGDGLGGGIWHLARPEPKVVQVVDTSAGKVLADATGLSLYTFDRDTTSESTCYDDCADAWPALIVAADQALAAPFALTTRTDGQKQVTLSGHPLYFFAGDGAPGDVNGDGLGGVWHLARPTSK